MKIKINNTDVYFISDFHCFHHNVLKFDNRPFSDVHEMHNTIIKNWNNTVSPNSTVFYMGDLSFNSFTNTKPIVDSLVGNIYFINGNHDNPKDILKYDRWVDVLDMVDLQILDEKNVEQRKNKYQHLVLSHYPILHWNRKHYGSIHVHGHSHHDLYKSNASYYETGYVLDVGCNGIDYTPISYEDVKRVVQRQCKDLGYHHQLS